MSAAKASFVAFLFLPLIVCGPARSQDAGRLLASNCFQCHGTNGVGGFEGIEGESTDEIFEETKEQQVAPARAEPDEAIMAVHANGYTDAELREIAKFLGQQK